MADLSIGQSSGNQGGQPTTQNPQAAPAGQSIGGTSQAAGAVQPGATKNIQSTTAGQALQTSSITSITLAPTTAATASSKPKTAAKPAHHVNAVFFVITVVLVLIAIGLFWGINHAAKNTTE